MTEGQVFAQHKAIRRRSSVLFNPPFKRDDDDEDAEENDENVFLEDSKLNESRDSNNKSRDVSASSAVVVGGETASEGSGASNPFLERLKKDPRYSPLAIRRRSSSDWPSPSKSLTSKPSLSSPPKAKSTSSANKSGTATSTGGKAPPLRRPGAGSFSGVASPLVPHGGNNAPTAKSSHVGNTPTATKSATPKLKHVTTPKFAAMSPMAVRAINNSQMKNDSTGKSTTKSSSVGASPTAAPIIARNLSPSSSSKSVPYSPSSSSPSQNNNDSNNIRRVLTPNKNLLNSRTPEGGAGGGRQSSAARKPSFSLSNGDDHHLTPPNSTPTSSKGAGSASQRGSDSMELTGCSSPNLVRTSVSTSDESLLLSSSSRKATKHTPEGGGGDSDMELVVETTPSSLPK